MTWIGTIWCASSYPPLRKDSTLMANVKIRGEKIQHQMSRLSPVSSSSPNLSSSSSAATQERIFRKLGIEYISYIR